MRCGTEPMEGTAASTGARLTSMAEAAASESPQGRGASTCTSMSLDKGECGTEQLGIIPPMDLVHEALPPPCSSMSIVLLHARTVPGWYMLPPSKLGPAHGARGPVAAIHPCG
eukprot:CAMPEP_0172810534 /NCGR_PEP_ID=MMETSP1075-20121228/8862_1 /TAXON_ID=2916 /ORGANISM="Ceratium fusus, Strain PA161109" /LENGTH=112 /DNA_ID=CAMNT_0013649859 /DNA_START=476 /DNA_END=814 /DNA_ORIENTATION=+